MKKTTTRNYNDGSSITTVSASRKQVREYAAKLQSKRNLFVKEMIPSIMRKFKVSNYTASNLLGLID